MRTAVKTAAAWGAAGAVLAALLAAPAAARDSRAAAADRWIPSFSLVGGVAVQQQEASVDSTCAVGGPGDPFVNNQQKGSAIAPCLGLGVDRVGRSLSPANQPDPPPPAFPPQKTWRLNNLGPPGTFVGPFGVDEPGALRPAYDDDELAVSPFVGANLQLLTPVIRAIPGAPRLFVSGEVQFVFPPSYNVANEGDASGADLPGGAASYGATPALSLVGVGSRTTSEVQLLAWGANVGIAFPFRAFGRTLWVKPGAAWTQYQIEVEGVLVAGLKDDCCPDPGVDLPGTVNDIPALPWGRNLREVNLSADTTKIFNGIGPSLEIEMDVGRFGPVGASLFLRGAMFKILGDRSVSLSDTASAPILIPTYLDGRVLGVTLPADTYNANWSWEADPWMYRAAVGIRFHWLGN
jgi:hypothetical protein